MTYTRPTSSSPGADGSATDLTVILDALSDGLEAVEAALPGKETAGAAAAAQAAAIAASQPLDSDLTAIAALSTTSYGRAFLALADAAAARTALGLGTAATSASSAFDAAGAAAAAQAASQPVDSDLTAIAALTTTAYGRALLELADAAAGRTALGLGSAALLTTGDVDERARDALGTALTAGTGITVTPNDGADTITVATTAVLPTIVDAKGDLIVGTAADTVARLAVGTDTHVLTADSSTASGVKWAAAAGGAAFTAGTAAPSGGNDGDWCLETDRGALWRKASGTWSLIARVAAGGIAKADGSWATKYTSSAGWSGTNELGAFIFSGTTAQTQAFFEAQVGSPTITANAVQVASSTLAGAYSLATIIGAREAGVQFAIDTMPSSTRNLYVGLGLGYPSYPWPYLRISNAGAMTLFDGGGTSLKTLSGTMNASGTVVFKLIPGCVLVAARNAAGAILDQALFATNFAAASLLAPYGAQILVGGDGKATMQALEVFA